MPQEPDVVGNKAECTLGKFMRDSCISWSSTCQTGILGCDSDEMMAWDDSEIIYINKQKKNFKITFKILYV